MSTEAQLGLTFLVEGQRHAEVLVNELLQALGAVCLLAIKDRDLAAPPGSPSNGDRYLVAAAATGAWASQDGKLALYYSGWKFFTVREGWRLWVDDENLLLVYDGSTYKVVGTRAAAVADANQTISNPPTQAEVQALTDKVDELLGAMRTTNLLAP